MTQSLSSEFGPPIPVSIAREIGMKFQKSVVVILAIDFRTQGVHGCTWGLTATDKLHAAGWGEIACEARGDDLSQRRDFENFLTRSAAEAAAVIDALSRERDVLAQQLRELREANHVG